MDTPDSNLIQAIRILFDPAISHLQVFRRLQAETPDPFSGCCFSDYFDPKFLIKLMRSDCFEGSHEGTPLPVFQISSVEANRTCSALTC